MVISPFFLNSYICLLSSQSRGLGRSGMWPPPGHRIAADPPVWGEVGPSQGAAVAQASAPAQGETDVSPANSSDRGSDPGVHISYLWAEEFLAEEKEHRTQEL